MNEEIIINDEGIEQIAAQELYAERVFKLLDVCHQRPRASQFGRRA
jgi:hypothetical protein